MYESADTILDALASKRWASEIVCSGDCSSSEIQLSQAEGRWYVNKAGFGFVLRPRPTLEYEVALAHIEAQHA